MELIELIKVCSRCDERKVMIKLNKKQSDALDMVKKNNLSILTGGPGTGKTTATKAIVDWMKSEGYKISLCSPSGKAANILSEMAEHSASTIHRLLKPMPIKTNGKLRFEFSYNSRNPLPCTAIIIDECSMVDNNLAASLFQAIDHEKTKVLIVGDNNQLPSVAPGCVLRDLISCGCVPVTELTEVFRNSGEIINFCTAIRTDTHYDLPKALDVESGQNYVHIEASNPQTIHDTIVKLATENMPRRGYDTTRDVQILSPVNSKTILSCDALNESIQAIVNPQAPQDCINKSVFRLGSKVINCKNIYNSIDINGGEEIVLNGDCGIIIDLQGESKTMIIEFDNPKRKILVNKYDHHLKLSYCITSHRSQGSGFPVVIFPIHSCFSRQTNRALLYTSVSRAERLLITIGTRTSIQQARRNTDVYQRKTFLSSKIQNLMLDKL